MPYDLEKYRDKREKVLGVRRKGLSFGVWASLVAAVFILSLGSLVVPKSIAYLTTRNLDDAIFKLQGDSVWPRDTIVNMMALEGVKVALMDKGGARMVVTFDRLATDTADIMAAFREKGANVVMLNRVNHRQRVSTEKEEAEFEAL
ncbi:MAG: hypothetical protein JRF32_09840 [Deltaproteobacteria bacterium]|nr:hypothetical protein [Deltaproteobacteria bacterium]MBW2613322.1 hypothetical protein [Deltaproteobacteria bacterium]MBW2635106.1 hypothetical protein [Deltaproteobacteria bacterium]MBW2676085.1 hypothetical protein [Deltaproteobacteria bacterium]